MLYCGCVSVTMLCPTVKFISSTTKMLKISEVLCRVSKMSVVTLQCLQFYRRLSEEITQRRWENMPTGQTIQVNKDPQVCVELLSSNLSFPLLAAPISCIWHASLTNMVGTCGNSALLCLFLHWHKLVSLLQTT